VAAPRPAPLRRAGADLFLLLRCDRRPDMR
jgi:hypothetical protein